MRLRVNSAKDCVFRGAWRLSHLQPPQLASVPPATQISRRLFGIDSWVAVQAVVNTLKKRPSALGRYA